MIPFNNNKENTAVFFYINNRFLNQCTTKLIMIGLEDLVVPEGVIAQWLPLYALLTDIVKIWVLVIFYIYFYILLI